MRSTNPVQNQYSLAQTSALPLLVATGILFTMCGCKQDQPTTTTTSAPSPAASTAAAASPGAGQTQGMTPAELQRIMNDPNAPAADKAAAVKQMQQQTPK